MMKNIGNTERLIRVLVGLGVSSLSFWGPSNPWFLAGMILVVTGATGFCPPYCLLGVNTCQRK